MLDRVTETESHPRIEYRVAFSDLVAPLVGMTHHSDDASDRIARRAVTAQTRTCSESLTLKTSEAPRLTPALAHALVALIAHSGQVVDVEPDAIEEPCLSDAIVS